MHPINSTESTVLYRIDVPNHPLAIATSQYGSILDFPPTNINFRQVEWATTDTEENLGVVESQKALDGMNIRPWHDQGYYGQNVKIAVFDVEWNGVEWNNPEIEGATTQTNPH